jgi:hypothetical protein
VAVCAECGRGGKPGDRQDAKGQDRRGGSCVHPGLRLAREFYAALVRPLLEEHFPRLPYAAALLGPGSEVAGFDSQRSIDHDWGMNAIPPNIFRSVRHGWPRRLSRTRVARSAEYGMSAGHGWRGDPAWAIAARSSSAS